MYQTTVTVCTLNLHNFIYDNYISIIIITGSNNHHWEWWPRLTRDSTGRRHSVHIKNHNEKDTAFYLVLSPLTPLLPSLASPYLQPPTFTSMLTTNTGCVLGWACPLLPSGDSTLQVEAESGQGSLIPKPLPCCGARKESWPQAACPRPKGSLYYLHGSPGWPKISSLAHCRQVTCCRRRPCDISPLTGWGSCISAAHFSPTSQCQTQKFTIRPSKMTFWDLQVCPPSSKS